MNGQGTVALSREAIMAQVATDRTKIGDKRKPVTPKVVSVWISRGDWFCGALGRKVRTETSSRKESSEQERTTDKTLLCYLAGHREKGSAHTTMIALMFLVKNIVRVDLVVLAPLNTYEFLPSSVGTATHTHMQSY